MFRGYRFFYSKKLAAASIFCVLGFQYTQFPIKLNSQTTQPTTPNYVYNQQSYDTQKPVYSLKSRQEHLNDIKSHEYDVIIIGGGATGSGIALECAQRGLKAVVFETEDFAQGASSKSTKLVHGGVRYLQQVFELSLKGGRYEKFKLVIEALRERSTFLSLSQNFTREIPILIPCSNIFYAVYYYTGSMIYHLLYKAFAETNTFQFKSPRIVTQDELKLYFPYSDCSWGVLYSDGQFNDSRMVQELLLTSTIVNYNKFQQTPANILNYAEIISLQQSKDGRINGVKVNDKINQEEFIVQGSVVVNATGCFADSIRQLDDPNVKKRIVPSGGSHIVLPQKFSSKKWGYIIPKTTDGRVLFIVPWMNKTLVGTTEKQFNLPVKDPQVSFDEQIWLMKQFQIHFPNIPIADITSNVQSKWCGLRPLVHEKGFQEGEKIDTKQLARKHVIEISKSGLISVMGGKWTIYRKMGEETVDEIFKQIKQVNPNIQERPSVSKHIKLIGEFQKIQKEPIQNRKTHIMKYATLLNKQFKVPIKDAKYFIKMYGDRAFDIWKINQQNPELQQKLHPELPHTVGEIIYLIRNEMATKPQDILFRRTSLGFLDSQIIYKIYPQVIEIFAQEFNWDQKKLSQELYENLNYIRSLSF